MNIGWLLVVCVIVAFWAVPIAATLVLFPAGSLIQHRRTDHD